MNVRARPGKARTIDPGPGLPPVALELARAANGSGHAGMSTAFERYLAGDDAALHDVVVAYAPAAYSLAMAVLGDRGLAERAVEDAFARVASEARRYDPNAGPESAWILRQARDAALAVLRAHRQAGEPAAAVASEGVAAGDEVWREVMAAATPVMVRGAIESLSEAQRDVLTLAYWKGLPPAEIARLRGMPEEAVRENLRAGLERVRDALARAALEVLSE